MVRSATKQKNIQTFYTQQQKNKDERWLEMKEAHCVPELLSIPKIVNVRPVLWALFQNDALIESLNANLDY